MSKPTIKLPDADELDTAHIGATSGQTLELYLIPACETDDGVATVTTMHRIGSGMPMPAYHHRWAHLISVAPQTVGKSVLDWLESQTKSLQQLSDAYKGTFWNGNNHIGQWSDDVDLTQFGYELSYDYSANVIQSYWDASDYYTPGGFGWEELAREADVDPELALGADWESIVSQVAEAVERAQDEPVTGTERYLRSCAEEYREAHDEEDPNGQ